MNSLRDTGVVPLALHLVAATVMIPALTWSLPTRNDRQLRHS
jgi:hypothetical protein